MEYVKNIPNFCPMVYRPPPSFRFIIILVVQPKIKPESLTVITSALTNALVYESPLEFIRPPSLDIFHTFPYIFFSCENVLDNLLDLLHILIKVESSAKYDKNCYEAFKNYPQGGGSEGV